MKRFEEKCGAGGHEGVEGEEEERERGRKWERAVTFEQR